MLSYYNVLGSAAILFFKGTISKLVSNMFYVCGSRLSFPSPSSASKRRMYIVLCRNNKLAPKFNVLA